MLVISRRLNESVQFPNLGITVTLLKNTGSRIRLGIDAPSEVEILRSELADGDSRACYEDSHRGASSNRHLNSASNILRKLRSTVESMQWDDSRALLAAAFCELRSLDEQVEAKRHGMCLETQPPRRALLVDDNRNEARLLASYLRLKSFEVDVAYDGADAVEHLDRGGKPDVVLLDMNMPKYDGRWTVNKLRSDPQHCGLKILAVSGMEPDDYDVPIGEGGVNRWLRKPLNPEELVREIVQSTAPDPLLSA
ncbi:Response regulator rcp1 [Stieleria maiorica]|uniref:Translational regulator CsrA n=1 Tax=Stieleria maiorica TaxID=2795974 RepID=A0A5B9M4S4_9BACT|nr:response regulator [Stieleria maiorica]QEF96238.1 Response regulator rcp1 [Stieleria maiorica]